MATVSPIMNEPLAGISIRTAIEADADALVSYFHRVVDQSKNLTMESDEMDIFNEEAKFLRQLEQAQNSLALIALHENTIIACCTCVGGRRPSLYHSCELGISVDRAWWGKAVGSRLVQAVLDWARGANIAKINLQVRVDNRRAITMYEKFGFCKEAYLASYLTVDGLGIDLHWYGLRLPRLPLAAPDAHRMRVALSETAFDSAAACTIRLLTGKDASQVLEFAETLVHVRPELFATTDIPGVGASLTEQRVLLASCQDTLHWRCLGAFTTDGELVGMLTCESGTRKRTKHSARCTLSLLPPWEHTGLATAMVSHLNLWAKGTGLRRLESLVLSDDTHFVEAFTGCGFVSEGTISRSMMFNGRYHASTMLARYL